MSSPKPVSPLPLKAHSEMPAARTVSGSPSSVTPLTHAVSPSPSAPTNITSPAPQSGPVQLAIPSPSSAQPETQWTQRTAATGRIYLADRATGKTKWLWQKFSVKGKIFCENALTKEREWPNDMDLALKVAAGMATEDERKEWKATPKEVESSPTQTEEKSSSVAIKQPVTSQRSNEETTSPKSNFMQKSSKETVKAGGNCGKLDSSPAEQAESSVPVARSVASENECQDSLSPVNKGEVDEKDTTLTSSKEEALQSSSEQGGPSDTLEVGALHSSAKQSNTEQAVGESEGQEGGEGHLQLPAKPESTSATFTSKQNEADSSIVPEKRCIAEADSTGDTSQGQQPTMNKQSDNGSTTTDIDVDKHPSATKSTIVESPTSTTKTASGGRGSVESKSIPELPSKFVAASSSSTTNSNDLELSSSVSTKPATGDSAASNSTSIATTPTKAIQPSTVVLDASTSRKTLTEVQGIALKLDEKEAIDRAEVECSHSSQSPRKINENPSPARDVLGDHAAAASAAAAAGTVRAGADALEHSGSVRLAVDTVERMQLDVAPGALSPPPGAVSPRTRASVEALSPRVVGRLAAEKLQPYLTPNKESGTNSGMRFPDRATPSPVAPRTSATTTTPRSPSSRLFAPRAPSFGRRSEPSTPQTLPAPRSRSFTRRDAPATPPVGRTRSFSRRATGPPSAPSTPRGRGTGSAPGTPRGGRLSSFARSARRLVTSSNPATPIANATRRVFDAATPGTPRLTTPEPFYLRSVERHERAQKQLLERERRRLEEEDQAIKPFKALPMPDFNR